MSPGGGQPTDYRAMLLRGMKPAAVRRANQRAILLIIAREPGLSNADLARRSGLAPQTVSAVVADLEEAGLLQRGTVRRGKRGQPATPLYTDPSGAFSIGAEIGWTHIEVVLLSFGGEQIGHYRRSYDYPDAETIFGEIADQTNSMLDKLSARHRRRLVGMGLAAPADIGDPTSLMPLPERQRQLWAAIDIRACVAEATELDVQLFNDGNAACWAEFGAHAMPRPQSFVFLGIGTFVGAGILAQNRLWEGSHGGSANLGAMLVSDRAGTPKFLHEIASLFALRQRLSAAGTDLAAATAEPPAPAARRILDDWIEDSAVAIAQVLANTATVVEYHVAIIDAYLPRPILVTLVAAIQRQVASARSLGRQQIVVQAGQLGHPAAASGAAQLRFFRELLSRDLEHMDI